LVVSTEIVEFTRYPSLFDRREESVDCAGRTCARRPDGHIHAGPALVAGIEPVISSCYGRGVTAGSAMGHERDGFPAVL
jgi:hypothetical protein